MGNWYQTYCEVLEEIEESDLIMEDKTNEIEEASKQWILQGMPS